MHKNIAQTHGLTSLDSSTHILKQLQQNQSLRTQVYKLKAFIKSQSNKHQNTLTSQQMVTQKSITSLRMAIKNQKSLKKQQSLQQSHQFLCNTIQKCLYDFQNLCQLLDSAKMECERQLKQNQLSTRPQSGTMNKNPQSFQGLLKQRDIINIKYQTFMKENQQLKKKLLETFEELKNCKLSMNKLQHTINQQKQDIRQKQNQVRKLQDQNDGLVAKLKENQEVSRKHAEYFRKKSEEIQQQNEKLVILHRDAVFREKQLMKMVEEGQLQILNLVEEAKRLKYQLQVVELKMNEIIQKQEKIKSLQSVIHRRGMEDKALKQIINKENITKPNQQSKSQQTLKIKKKFNLQFFQQKLCSSTSLAC